MFYKGKPIGKFIWYDRFISIFATANYKNGKLHGPLISYSPDGQLAEKGEYKNGRRVCPWKFYENGGGEPVSPLRTGATRHSGSDIYDGVKISCLEITPAEACFIPQD